MAFASLRPSARPGWLGSGHSVAEIVADTAGVELGWPELHLVFEQLKATGYFSGEFVA
jgi:hypothetical protein